MPNPVRLYVLHHPESKLGRRLTNRIYDWFRLPSLEGIPVYVRSAPCLEGDRPAKPYRAMAKNQKDKRCLEYIVPLVDAEMVRDPVWHDYLAEIARQCEVDAKNEQKWGWRMFPVALDSTAYNLPDGIARMNFIRHGSGAKRVVVVPGAPEEREQLRQQLEQETEEAEETLKHLTEAVARDLNDRIFPEPKAARFEVFISYARADSADEAKALRDYIQSQTQCLVFFDENDIGYGTAFDRIITSRAGGYSKALIVLNSDHYADRPWCRMEVDRFTEPRQPLPRVRGAKGSADLHVFLPLLVVDNMKGPKMTLVVPELAQAPVVRWAPGREKLCFSVLMREVVFGLRDVLEATTIPWVDLTDAVIVNRLPGPVPLAKLLRADRHRQPGRPITVHYPGHGLSATELRLIEKTFPHLGFRAFRDIVRGLPEKMEKELERLEKKPETEAPLREKVIVVLAAHHRDDLAALGYLPQHQDEALIHLLRPLVRLGADLLYGGLPPKRDLEAKEAGGEDEYRRNITLTLLHLMSSERRGGDLDAKRASRAKPQPGPMLFNLCSWPNSARVDSLDEATWVNACHVKKVEPEHADLPLWRGKVPAANGIPCLGQRRYQALTFSFSRRLLAAGFTCRVPGKARRRVQPAAFVLVGGAMSAFKGVMPGVLEEFLCAATAPAPAPIYLVGGLGGATGAIARALLAPASAPPPKELLQEFFLEEGYPGRAEYQALLDELTDAEKDMVTAQFQKLWDVIAARRRAGTLANLFSNGLDDKDNRSLLSTTSTVEAVQLIWKGMSQVLLSPARRGRADGAARGGRVSRVRRK